MKYTGISNGKKYEVIKIDPDNPNIGLTKFPESGFTWWCTFDSIEISEDE
jgi:hypothetical protein